MNDLDDITLTLENDVDFYRAYIDVKGNHSSAPSTARRELIKSYTARLCGKVIRVADIAAVRLEQYFNERYNLCPYGLRSQAEMEALQTIQHNREVVKQTNDFITEKENEMTQTTNTVPTIETKTFINGVDASTLTDDQIFNQIRGVEAQIDELKKVKTKPKKLEAKIADMEKAIAGLVEFVDNRA